MHWFEDNRHYEEELPRWFRWIVFPLVGFGFFFGLAAIGAAGHIILKLL